AGLLPAHVTVRPDSGFPAESFGVAVSCSVCPTSTEAVAALSLPDALPILLTVIAAVPLLPSLVAVIVTDPAATPKTSPLALTVAMAVLLLAHVTVRPDSRLPAESFGVAVSCTVCPTSTEAVAGLTVTDATGTFLTVIAAVPLLPPLLPVIVADPAATPAPSPLALT